MLDSDAHVQYAGTGWWSIDAEEDEEEGERATAVARFASLVCDLIAVNRTVLDARGMSSKKRTVSGLGRAERAHTCMLMCYEGHNC